MTNYKRCARCNDDMQFATDDQVLCKSCKEETSSIIHHGISLTKARELTPEEWAFIQIPGKDWVRCNCCSGPHYMFYLNWRYGPDAQRYYPSWECEYCFGYSDELFSQMLRRKLDVDHLRLNQHKVVPNLGTCAYCGHKTQHLGYFCEKSPKPPFMDINLNGKAIDGTQG